ncbi:MAG: methyltransferase [Hyphomicrobium sp.]
MTISDLRQEAPVDGAERPSVTGPVTDDVFLGDRLVVRQPRHGYRAGIDAVLLAASVRLAPDDAATLLDIGAGAGTVGLCAAARLPDLRAVLLEREPALVAMAGGNITANGLAGRVRAVAGSITASATDLAALGLAANSFSQCVANPPYHDEEAGTPARDALKAASHAMPADALDDWARFMARMVRPGGRATMIHKADALPRLLAVLAPRFGALAVFPVFPRAGEDAIRVIVSGIKGSRAPMTLRAGLVLHGAGQDFTDETSAILRGGGALEI